MKGRRSTKRCESSRRRSTDHGGSDGKSDRCSCTWWTRTVRSCRHGRRCGNCPEDPGKALRPHLQCAHVIIHWVSSCGVAKHGCDINARPKELLRQLVLPWRDYTLSTSSAVAQSINQSISQSIAHRRLESFEAVCMDHGRCHSWQQQTAGRMSGRVGPRHSSPCLQHHNITV